MIALLDPEDLSDPSRISFEASLIMAELRQAISPRTRSLWERFATGWWIQHEPGQDWVVFDDNYDVMGSAPADMSPPPPTSGDTGVVLTRISAAAPPPPTSEATDVTGASTAGAPPSTTNAVRPRRRGVQKRKAQPIKPRPPGAPQVGLLLGKENVGTSDSISKAQWQQLKGLASSIREAYEGSSDGWSLHLKRRLRACGWKVIVLRGQCKLKKAVKHQ